MQIRVDKDNLRFIKLSQLESGEVKVTEVNFIFSTEYEGLSKVAVFTLGDKSYKVILQNDKCFVPQEVLVEGNKITIGLYAFKSEGEELILRYSPVPVTAEILKGSYVEYAENSSDPTPTEIEQLINLIQNNTNSINGLTESINELSGRVDSLEQDNDKCSRDIEDIKDDIFNIKSDIQDLEGDVTSIRSDITDINENIDDINGDISDINNSITNIERVDERQNIILNYINNILSQLPKTEYKKGSNINLGKTIQAPLEFEDDILGYGNAEQEGTPTPETPIPISVVTGEQEVVVRGKNLFKAPSNDSTINGVDVKIDNSEITYNGTVANNNNITPNGYNYVDLGEFEAGTYSVKLYQLSGTYNLNDKSTNIYIRNGEKTTLINIPMATLLSENRTFTIDTKQHIYFQQYAVASIEFVNFNFGVQIESGNTATTYEPYIEPTTQTINLGDLEFAGIGDYADEIVYDEEADKFYKKKAINKIILNGTETWNMNSITNAYVFKTTINDYLRVNTITAICNYFKAIANGTYGSMINGQCRFRYYSDSLNELYFCLSDITNIADFKTWLTTHNLIVYYVLATETLEEITDTTLIEELKNLYNMQSVEGTTIIEVNGNLPLILKVRAYAQLQAAI